MISDGEQEFKEVINYINICTLDIPPDVKDDINILSVKWSSKDKILSDYSEIKIYHRDISNYITYEINDPTLSRLWEIYTDAAQEYRIKLIRLFIE